MSSDMMTYVNDELKKYKVKLAVIYFKTLAKYMPRGTEENRVISSCDSRATGIILTQYVSTEYEGVLASPHQL